MINLLTVTNAADKGAVAQTNFERLDPLLSTPLVTTAVKADYVLLKLGASYYRVTLVQDGALITLQVNQAPE